MSVGLSRRWFRGHLSELEMTGRERAAREAALLAKPRTEEVMQRRAQIYAENEVLRQRHDAEWDAYVSRVGKAKGRGQCTRTYLQSYDLRRTHYLSYGTE